MDRNINEEGARKEEAYALDFLRSNFSSVEVEPARSDRSRVSGQTVLVKMGRQDYVCAIHTAMPRADRLLPQLALALLHARKRSRLNISNSSAFPLVVVESTTQSLLLQVQSFAADFLRGNEALGVLGMDGSRLFVGEGVEQFTVKLGKKKNRHEVAPTLRLFSDTHQWLLKVLLAEHFPERLLTAKRGPFHSGRQLAEAAGVSPVTANRFLVLLKEMGYLDATNDAITIIRHKDLFLRWRAGANESKKEVPIRFLWRADIDTQLRCLLDDRSVGACLGLFGAAQALGLGHVSGVKPHVYVPKLALVTLGDGSWESMDEASGGAAPDFYLRQAPAPVSVFNGAVNHGGVLCTDVIQTWLDVSYYPSRGQEQANLIQEKFLRNLFEPHLS